jgi:ketosteroid isomerase-like protein
MTLLPIAQQLYSAFGQGNIPAILELLDENVQWEKWSGDNMAQKAGVPWLKERHGKEGALAFFQLLGSTMQFKEFQVLNLMEGGNQVAAEILVEIELPETGNHYRDEEIHLFTFNDAGKVIRFRHYADTHKHMMAAEVVTSV